MPINVLFGNIVAKSNLAAPFTSAWSQADSLSWGIERPISSSVKSGGTALAVGEFKGLELAKKVDGTSASLNRSAIVAQPIGNVAIAVLDGTKTVVAFKLTNVYVVKYSLNSDGSPGMNGGFETISLWYQQIAMATLAGGALTSMGWDLATNNTWSFPGATFSLDATYGIKVA